MFFVGKHTRVRLLMTSTMLCEYCIKQQDQLLMDGDGSQVICDHLEADNVDCADLTGNSNQAEKKQYVQTTFISDAEFLNLSRNGNQVVKKKRKGADVATTFISDADFLSKVAKHDAVKWGDVATNVVFKIENISTCKTKYGERKIVNLKNADGDVTRAFLTEVLTNKLDTLADNCGNLYVMALGIKQCKNDKKRSYHAFHLVSADDTTALFISESEFLSKVQKKDAINWGEVPTHVVYKIGNISTIKTKYGVRKIAELKVKNGGEVIRAFLTELLTKELAKVRDSYKSLYVMPLGIKKCKSDENRTFHAFHLVEV